MNATFVPERTGSVRCENGDGRMADVLIYWRDYAANWAYQFAGDRAFYWHSSAKCIAELQPGDRMWMVTSGGRKGTQLFLGHERGSYPSVRFSAIRQLGDTGLEPVTSRV